MVPRLIAIKDGPDLILDKPILLVGRHQECDVQIPSRKISRKHCCIAQVDDHLVVRDLYSTNGVKINGTKVPEGILHHGDELTIGNLQYRVEWQLDSESETRRPNDGIQAKPPLPGPRGLPGPKDWELSGAAPIALDEKSGLPTLPAGSSSRSCCRCRRKTSPGRRDSAEIDMRRFRYPDRCPRCGSAAPVARWRLFRSDKIFYCRYSFWVEIPICEHCSRLLPQLARGSWAFGIAAGTLIFAALAAYCWIHSAMLWGGSRSSGP